MKGEMISQLILAKERNIIKRLSKIQLIMGYYLTTAVNCYFLRSESVHKYYPCKTILPSIITVVAVVIIISVYQLCSRLF